MSRSVKKGPFAAPELLKRVDEMNAAGEKNLARLARWAPVGAFLAVVALVALVVWFEVFSGLAGPMQFIYDSF